MTPIEVFKLAIGPFFGAVTGASLAFTFNWLVQWRLQRRDDIAAGNLALFRLYRIIHEASMLRAQIRTRLAEDEHANPGAPIWSFHDPLLHTFQMVEALDYGPLTFLLKTEQGKKTLCDVNVADRIYAELQDQWRLLRETNADLKKGLFVDFSGIEHWQA